MTDFIVAGVDLLVAGRYLPGSTENPVPFIHRNRVELLLMGDDLRVESGAEPVPDLQGRVARRLFDVCAFVLAQIGGASRQEILGVPGQHRRKREEIGVVRQIVVVTGLQPVRPETVLHAHIGLVQPRLQGRTEKPVASRLQKGKRPHPVFPPVESKRRTRCGPHPFPERIHEGEVGLEFLLRTLTLAEIVDQQLIVVQRVAVVVNIPALNSDPDFGQ